ncbi:hypothetical protein SAMN06297387_111185 [Streptomyces zhaozhouensis]|uniref:Uncharacterized protein n=1 Tax=Streptomyces zhaozhouensis TaxID=1300267 RepID=A0A286DYC2_9ACTN|nr:hypothetical protein [Streptomyces zhaozhouensis]SOD63636.1 hypothetical protein SAMN06297387_111185 [Streptomyces zhaozhouensis]
MSAYGQQQPGPYTPPPAVPTVPALPQQIHIAGLVGGALAALGSLLAWASIEANGQSESEAGLSGDGLWTLLLGIATIALFGAGMATKKPVLTAAAAAPSLITLIFGAINLFDPERVLLASAEDDGVSEADAKAILEMVDVSSGFGIYLVVIGALGALVAGAIAATKLKK